MTSKNYVLLNTLKYSLCVKYLWSLSCLRWFCLGLEMAFFGLVLVLGLELCGLVNIITIIIIVVIVMNLHYFYCKINTYYV